MGFLTQNQSFRPEIGWALIQGTNTTITWLKYKTKVGVLLKKVFTSNTISNSSKYGDKIKLKRLRLQKNNHKEKLIIGYNIYNTSEPTYDSEKKLENTFCEIQE